MDTSESETLDEYSSVAVAIAPLPNEGTHAATLLKLAIDQVRGSGGQGVRGQGVRGSPTADRLDQSVRGQPLTWSISDPVCRART